MDIINVLVEKNRHFAKNIYLIVEKNRSIELNEVVFGTSDKTLSKQITREVRKGTLRKIAPRIYTTNLDDDPATIVNRNLFFILANQYPNAVLSHRSALEFRPTSTGDIFVSYKYTKKAKLPGITIHLLKGQGAVEGDNPIVENLYASQRARAFLENLQVSRKPGSQSKTLSPPELEEQLDQIIQTNGEDAINELRDKARDISDQLGMEKEYDKLNKLVSALLTTHPKKILTSSVAKARAAGLPYDPARISLFETLFQALIKQEFRNWSEKNTTTQQFRNFAFFESYFSNYIEGTVFGLDEAKQIVETQTPMPNRSADSHDVLGTYQIVSNQQQMNTVPTNPDELEELLKNRHSILMSARTDKRPGKFKEENNYAGSTSFVDFKLVRGTLTKGFEFYAMLSHPFAKAAYMMFLISEVHPFLDGNGRIARILMNAELTRGGQSKIIIPNVYRGDYLGALRRLTRQSDADVFVRMLSKAHHFSATITGDTMDEMQDKLERSNAFYEHTEGYLLKIID